MDLAIREASAIELRTCASHMRASRPWVEFKYTNAECLRKLRSKDSTVLVALKEKHIVGFAQYRLRGIGSCSQLMNLYVAPELRRRGVGTRLMEEVELRVFTTDRNLLLFVSDFNSEAQAFYRAQGYIQVGALDNYNLEGQAELLFRKTIGVRR